MKKRKLFVISTCNNVDEFYRHTADPIKSDTKSTDCRIPFTERSSSGKANLQ